MGFKKEKLLSGLLARKRCSPKEVQKNTSPVVKENEKKLSTQSRKSSLPDTNLGSEMLSGSDQAKGGRTRNDQSSKIMGTDEKFKTLVKSSEHPSEVRAEEMGEQCVSSRNKSTQQSRSLEASSDAPSATPKPASDCTDGSKREAEGHVSNTKNPVLTPESCTSLELPSTPGTVVEVKSLASNERNSNKNSQIDFSKNKDASKLSVVISNTIPLSSHGTGGDPVPRTPAHVPNVSRVRIERPSTALKHHITPRHDHNYCIQAFNSTQSPTRVIHDRSFHICLPADYGICSSIPPNIAWGVPYSPATVTGYQVCPAPDYPSPASCDTSSCWGLTLDTKEDLLALQNVGLTRIDLERLAETGCISESLFACDKSRDERRQDRIKERRETFLAVMQGRSRSHHEDKPRYEDIARNNQIIGKWLKLDSLEVDDISRLLEDTADILYGRKKTGAEQFEESISSTRHLPAPKSSPFRRLSPARRQPPHGYRHPATFNRGTFTSSPQRQRARVISSVRRKLHFDCGPIPVSARCQDVGMDRRVLPSPARSRNKIHKFASSLPATKCISKELDKGHKIEADVASNPPACEQSICSRENSVTSLELEATPCCDLGKTKSSNVPEATEDKATVSQSPCRSLRSRIINISTKTKQPVKQVQGKGEKKEQRKGDCKMKTVEKDEVDSSARDWVKLSEDWINEPLNMTTILPLL